MAEAYIYDTLRTPRGKGKKNGALYEVRPLDLLSHCLKALESRNHLDTTLVDDVVIGCVTPIGEQGGNIAKTAALYAGWSPLASGMQINRFCASGLEAVNTAAMKVASGWEELVVAGGLESMSRVPMGADGGPMMHDPKVSQSIGFVPQGISADLIATLEGYSRLQLDEYALSSQQRAGNALEKGYFKKAIIPVCDANGLVILENDEFARPDTTIEGLSSLAPSFEALGGLGYDDLAISRYPQVERVQHVHTAGNSSGIVDGAALVLVGSKSIGEKLQLKPRAKVLAIANSGTEPTIMLLGPIPAAHKALQKAGLKPKDIDLWEMNEAFAAPVLKFQEALGIPSDRLNVNGGAISLGHPLGATGAVLIGMMLDELERRDLKRGLVTLCVGGGMGVATIIERV